MEGVDSVTRAIASVISLQETAAILCSDESILEQEAG